MSATKQSSIQCDYENEFTLDDEEMVKELKFKNELLELKETGEYEKFWKQAAEVIREDLSSHISANEEASVHNLFLFARKLDFVAVTQPYHSVAYPTEP